MKIAIFIAISVIFASGTYTAFAEEPIPELIFEGGIYEIYKGNQILIPIKIQVENHDHRIIPKILTIYGDEVVNSTKFASSQSGTFQTFLIINENYKSGEYYIQMDYDGMKTNSESFTISRDHLGPEKDENSRTPNFYSNLPKRDSSMKISSNEISVGFSYPHLLSVSGVFGDAGSKGKVELKIDGPMSYTSKTGYTSMGDFESKVIVNRDWPSGQYTITALGDGVVFATDVFTVENRNQVITEMPITGTIELDSITSNGLQIILIEGRLQGMNIPQTIGIEISKDDHMVDMLTTQVQSDGAVDTSLVLYDYSSRSSWQSGKYVIKFVDTSENSSSYSAMDDFIITESGDTIVNTSEGVKISKLGDERMMTFGELLVDEGHVIHEINIFGELAEYTKATGGFESKPVDISIVGASGEIKKYSIFGKSDGVYSMPLLIDEEWTSGKYDVYVNYNDITKHTMSFTLGQELELDVQMEEEVKEDIVIIPQKFDIIFDDYHKTELVNFNFSATSTIKNNEQVRVIIEKPDGSEEYLYFNTVEGRQINIPLPITNSWSDGIYTLSFIDDDEIRKFGELTIHNEETQSDVFILAQHLDTANPDMIYPISDELLMESNKVSLTRGDNSHLKFSGGVANYNSGDIEIQTYKNGEMISAFKATPRTNGSFFTTSKIDDAVGSGFFEVRAVYSDREFAVSEFLIVQPNIITTQFGSEPIQISRDMFVESGGMVSVKLVGPINNYKYADSGMIVFTIYKPNGMMETFETEIKKWGYFAYNLPVTSEWQNGMYIISAQLGEKKAGHMYIQILDSDMNWVKNMTHDWINDDMSTYQYTNRLNTAIQDGAIRSEPIDQETIPGWFKNTAVMWAEDNISETEFVEALKFVTIS